MSTVAQANYPHHHTPKRSSLSTHLDAADNERTTYVRPIPADETPRRSIFSQPWLHYLSNLLLNTIILLAFIAVVARFATVVADHATAVTDLIKSGTCGIPELSIWTVDNGRIISPIGWTVAALYILLIPLLATRSTGEYEPTFHDFRVGTVVGAFLGVAAAAVTWVAVVGVLIGRDLYACGGSLVTWAHWGLDYVNETEAAIEQYRLVKSGRARLVEVDGRRV